MGPDDDLFRLGGDSLKAAQILAAVDAVFGVRIELAGALAEGFTVAAVARRIESARAMADGNAGRPAGETAPRPQPRNAGPTRFPLSFGQERLWFVERLAPDAAAYNEAQAYRMRGALDLDALATAFQGLVDRHETLRTAFGSDDGMPYQEVLPAVSARLQVHDLASLDAPERDAAAARLWTEAMLAPFDLRRPPLLRMVVLRLGPHEHVLFRVIHHIVSDAWSNGVMRRELSALYRAARAGAPPSLPPLAIQYADHTVWQRARAGGDALAASLDYWAHQLAGAPAVLALPTDRLRPAVPSHDGGMVVANLPAGLVSRLERCAGAEQATLFMVLLAAFQVLLYRCSGEPDVVTGTPIAGRDAVEAEGLIGFFVNTLALRADLSDAPTFRQHLARVRRTVLDAFRHQAAPFEQVVDRLRLERARNVSPLVQVLFAFQNVPQSGWDLDGIAVERMELARERAKVDLTVTVTQEDGGARMALTYATDLFEQATIDALAAGYRLVLEQIVEDLDRPVTALPRAVAAGGAGPAVAWPSETIHDRFAAVAASRADAVAVVDDAGSLTYRALDRAAARLAARLAAAGVRPGDRVGVLARRSAGFVVAVLAVVKSGAAYVPLDPEQPPGRLAAILDDAGIAAVLATLSLAGRVADGPATILIDDEADPEAPPPDVPVPPAGPDDPVYVIYTSGSTGRPKGVVAAQRGVIRLVVDTTYVRFAPADTIAHLSNVAFDAATFEIWGALLNGARLAVAAPATVMDPAALARWLADARIDTMFMTSALFSRMAEAAPGCFRGVGQLLVGGDRVSPAAARAVLRDGAPRRLLNGYGPTETTTFALTHEIAAVDPAARSVPIGRPIDGTTARICDAAGAEVPPLVLGEIAIGGPGVALGYHGNPALTAARFVPDPDAPGRRLYLTGDLARRLPDGAIDFLGRRDRQVKIRGFRVEPAEIEAALRDVAGVGEAHVAARVRDGEAELVGYVVPRDAAAADVGALRTALQRALPAYMVPRAIVAMPALPLTPNGKVDEKHLPDPGAAARPAPLLRAPRDAEEAAIAAVWRDVLGRDDIGIDDSFFDLGGHSLLAARLFARLDAALGRALPMSILFESPTIEALAQAYRRAAAAPEAGALRALVPIQPKGSRGPVFAVPGLGGNVIGFAEVARILGDEQPFYGLQSIGLDGSERPLESIEAIAARFVEEIRVVQPHGPYRLLGACLGAAVTLEMAHQLVAAGERIAFLGFLDPSGLAGHRRGQRGVALPPAVRDHLALPRFAAARIGHYWRALRALEPRDQVAFVADRLRLLGEIVRERDLFRGDRRELNQRMVEEANLRALYGYEPRPFPGAIHILASSRGDDPRRRRGERFDWTQIGADGCTVVRLASHDSGSAVAPPYVAETSAALARWLAAAG
ncbi:MAG: amino acid adenylation domain-containing protein, partial [Rhodospirillaceae bacterium]